MARTTPALVKGLLLSDYDINKSPDLTPFIDTASIVMDNVVIKGAAKGVILSGVESEMIERWLAAHYYAVNDKPFQSKGTEGASATFIGQTGMYLEATLYGQTAMRIDRSGVLANIGGKQPNKAGGFWLGKPPSSQLDYSERD